MRSLWLSILREHFKSVDKWLLDLLDATLSNLDQNSSSIPTGLVLHLDKPNAYACQIKQLAK